MYCWATGIRFWIKSQLTSICSGRVANWMDSPLAARGGFRIKGDGPEHSVAA